MLKIEAKAIKLPIMPLMLFLLVTAAFLLYPAQAVSPTFYASIPNIQTDKTDYSPEQIVKVTGSGFNISQTYAIPVMRPDGSIVKGDGSFTSGWDCVTTDENGGFNYSYQLDGVAGTYTVRVYPSTWTGNWNDAPIASTTFTDCELYYLTVNSLYDTPGGSGWYDEGSTAYASLAAGAVFDSSGARYTFTGWSGDASGSGLTSDAIVMDANKTATATWTTAQYQVTFAQSGLDADAAGTVVTVFGSDAKVYVYLPNSTFVSDGVSVSFSYAGIVGSSVPGKKYVLTSVSGNTTSSTVTVNGVVTVTGTYKTQYMVSFAASPSEAGTTSPSGANLWEDAGALSISATADTNYTFSSWSSSTGSITFADANLASTTATISGAGTITAMLAPNTVNAVFFKVNPVAESIPYSILAALVFILLCYVVERRRKTVGRKNLRLITSGITVAAAALVIAAMVSAGVAAGYGINASELLDFTNWAVVFLSLAAPMFMLMTMAIIRKAQGRKLLPSLRH